MKNQILKYICYFDVFNHPVKKSELINLCAGEPKVLEDALANLLGENKCFQFEDYYALKENVSELVEIRKSKEQEAVGYLKKLPFYARLIRSFPFVSGIAISGSLSKGVMHDDGDIDYFIITEPGRLWICRTLLVGFKKVFLFNSKKYFCVNYFIDEDNLLIPDNNIFTAVEVSHLLPVYNKTLIENFKMVNSWSDEFVSPFEHPVKVKNIEGKSWIGRFIAFTFKGKMGDRLDLRLMKFTYKKWEKKFKHFDATKFDLTMRTNRGVSKHHPRDFQNKVLKAFEERTQKLNINE